MSLTYFTDRDLGLQFPKILSSAGLMVERHRDHFAPNAPDEEWLAVVGAKGWVALTHNSRIRKVYRASPAELERNPSAPGRIELWLQP